MRQFSQRVFIGGLSLALVATIALLGVAIAQQQQRSRADLVDRFEIRAQLAARFVEAYVEELAGHQRDVAATRLAAPHVTRADFEQVVAGGSYPAAVLLDTQGRLLHVAPRAPRLQGRRLTSGYAHLRAAVTTGRIAVSNVVPSAALGIPVAAVAVPFWSPSGRRVFSGAYDLAHSPLSAYLANFHPVRSARAAILDANGRIVASDGRAPWRGSEGTAVAEIPVAGTPWKVRASVSERQLLAPVGGARTWLPWLILAALAALGAVAITLASRRRRSQQQLREAHAELTYLAMHDPLTGLWNRRRFEEELVRTVGRAHRYGESAALLVLDVDRFKAVNDASGTTSVTR